MDATQLYRVPLDEFVTARSALAKQLRSSGDREGAAAVAAMRKPALGAWVVDQVAYKAPDVITELLAAAADAGDAQRRAMSRGSASADDVRKASARFAEMLGEVGIRAREVLEASGHPVSETTVQRVRNTAHAAAAGGPATRAALFRGTLDREAEPPGFGASADADADDPDVAQAIAARRRSRSTAVPGTKQDAHDASNVHELHMGLRSAEREADEKRREADRASAAHTRAAERADRLAREARAAADEAAALEVERASAEAAAQAAATRRDRARASLEGAQP